MSNESIEKGLQDFLGKYIKDSDEVSRLSNDLMQEMNEVIKKEQKYSRINENPYSFNAVQFTLSGYHLVNILSAMKKAQIMSGDWSTEIPFMTARFMRDHDIKIIHSNTETFTLDELENCGEWYNPKRINITINGENTVVYSREFSYLDIVHMAYVGARHNILYTISYSKADGEKTEGTVMPGQTIKIKEGTHISCYHTGAA